MAKKFRFNGTHAPAGITLGPVLAFRFHGQDGTPIEITPNHPAKHFNHGDLLDLTDIDDERVLRHLRADPRFTEI